MKEKEYLDRSYRPLEHQFVTVNNLPNFECQSTQRSKSLHPAIRGDINRQTPIQEAVKELRDELISRMDVYQRDINQQRNI